MSYVILIHVPANPDITEEESSLADLVVTGTNLLTKIEDILKGTESLTSIAGEKVS